MIAQMANQRGMALIICLMTLTILGVIGLWAMKISSLNRQTAHNHVHQHQAFYLAEAGVGNALAAIRENPLWRGADTDGAPPTNGSMAMGPLTGTYGVTLFDATDDDNGKWDSLLPGGIVRLVSEGRTATAYQSVACRIRLSPVAGVVANSPQVAVVSAGPVTVSGGMTALMGFDEFGRPALGMIQAGTALPRVSLTALKALADHAIGELDNRTFDQYLAHRVGFWRDSPADAMPRITWVLGNLDISGNRRLHGIVYVAGNRVVLSHQARVVGILYAPNARTVVIPVEGSPGDHPVMGQLIAGPGGVRTSGNLIGVQLVREYVAAFNDVCGGPPGAHLVPGSWHSPM